MNILTNQSQLTLRGGGGIKDSANGDALITLSTNGTSGTLKLLDNKQLLTFSTTFTNAGVIELSNSSLDYSGFSIVIPGSFTNTTTGQIRGQGTIGAFNILSTFTNDGLISPGTSPGILEIEASYGQIRDRHAGDWN